MIYTLQERTYKSAQSVCWAAYDYVLWEQLTKARKAGYIHLGGTTLLRVVTNTQLVATAIYVHKLDIPSCSDKNSGLSWMEVHNLSKRDMMEHAKSLRSYVEQNNSFPRSMFMFGL